MKNHFLALTLLLVGGQSLGDIAAPRQIQCTVTSVTPQGANFFGFGPGPQVGETTSLDLDAAEITRLEFSSGAFIGAAVIKRALVPMAGTFEGFSAYELKFTSKHNGGHYHARLLASDTKDGAVQVSLDVVEDRHFSRLGVHSLTLACGR